MGTTTFFLRHNDMAGEFSKMSKGDLKKLDELKSWGDKNRYYGAWTVPLELHNGNAHILLWWYGRLMRLEEAPKLLTGKYFSRFKGKRINAYEWTVFKQYAIRELNELDKEFKRRIRRSKRLADAGKTTKTPRD